MGCDRRDVVLDKEISNIELIEHIFGRGILTQTLIVAQLVLGG